MAEPVAKQRRTEVDASHHSAVLPVSTAVHCPWCPDGYLLLATHAAHAAAEHAAEDRSDSALSVPSEEEVPSSAPFVLPVRGQAVDEKHQSKVDWCSSGEACYATFGARQAHRALAASGITCRDLHRLMVSAVLSHAQQCQGGRIVWMDRPAASSPPCEEPTIRIAVRHIGAAAADASGPMFYFVQCERCQDELFIA